MSWFLQPRGKRARGGKDGRTWPEKKALSDIATNHRVWSKQESGDRTIMAESEEELKILLVKVKEKSEKAGLKLNIQKT